MFVVDPNPTFTHPVKVKVPVDGGYEEQSFKVTFNVIPTDEVADFDLGNGEGSTAFLRRAVKHMDDLIGKDEKPVPYSDKLRDLLLGQLYVRKALARAYFDAMSGAQSGN
ncbi:hypothetical protein OVY48_09870 [Sphingobium sp. SA2]|uniref:hypothetical protein n=1 Tax=Sphingobium sp. SA2 TaxID=1524832 RepID=UPI0028BFFB3C|nr:hypothetical protein [Sphingobium sp. SA2]MDT7533730.1 hypothetical protein [Sphingobium sp. SA2]